MGPFENALFGFQPVHFVEPQPGNGVAGHGVAASRRKGNPCDIGAVGHAGALELLGEKPAVKDLHQVF